SSGRIRKTRSHSWQVAKQDTIYNSRTRICSCCARCPVAGLPPRRWKNTFNSSTQDTEAGPLCIAMTIPGTHYVNQRSACHCLSSAGIKVARLGSGKYSSSLVFLWIIDCTQDQKRKQLDHLQLKNGDRNVIQKSDPLNT
ncbi:mCG144983, partial [Mus musculus]